MKTFIPKFTVGSLFICSKCGKSFDQPENAETLKTALRADLKQIEATTKVRVMVGSCLGVCEIGEQAIAYYPNNGEVELYTVSSDFESSKKEILDFISKKII